MNESGREMNKNSNSELILGCRELVKSFKQGDNLISVLNGINLEINKADTVSIIGSSGSGKSTLLHLLSGLEAPTSGVINIDGDSLNTLTDFQICKLRNQKMGFVYQFHHLLPEFTAFENVLMPLIIYNKVNSQSAKEAKDLLEYLGLKERLHSYPATLSGGERQRVAIARAVINKPQIIFADEPTGNLDFQTGQDVFKLLLKLQAELKTTLIIVTHDSQLAAKTNTCYKLKNGSLTIMTKDKDAENVER